MHLIQVGYGEFIDAERILGIDYSSPSKLLIMIEGGDISSIEHEFKDQAIKDILMNCTPTNGRDALQRMVSE